MSTTKTPAIEDLLAHADWLRGLAARLVGAEADDLVQDTWVAALRAPPRGSGDEARPWLARVLRNSAISRFRRAQGAQRGRARAGRGGGSAGFARSAARAGPAFARAGRAGRRARRAAAYGRAPAPLRRQDRRRDRAGAGLPAGTVRWRLHEATERLRARLDQRHGNRKQWRALLLPLAWPRAKAAAPAAGGAAMAPVALVTGALLLGAIVLGGFAISKQRQLPAPAADAVAVGRGPVEPAARLLRFDPAEAPASLGGRVLDQHGAAGGRRARRRPAGERERP